MSLGFASSPAIGGDGLGLLALARGYPLLRYAADQVIVPFQDHVDSLFLISSGLATMSSPVGHREEVVFGVLGPSDAYGLRSLQGVDTSWSELRALTPVTCRRVPRKEVLAWLATEPGLALMLLENKSAIVESMRRRLEDRDAPPAERLLRVLQELAHKEPNGTVPRLRHAQLGCLCGLARETVSRTLKQLISEKRLIPRKDGWTL